MSKRWALLHLIENSQLFQQFALIAQLLFIVSHFGYFNVMFVLCFSRNCRWVYWFDVEIWCCVVLYCPEELSAYQDLRKNFRSAALEYNGNKRVWKNKLFAIFIRTFDDDVIFSFGSGTDVWSLYLNKHNNFIGTNAYFSTFIFSLFCLKCTMRDVPFFNLYRSVTILQFRFAATRNKYTIH